MSDQGSSKEHFSVVSFWSAAVLPGVFACFVALAAWLQWTGGAYHSEFGEEADAPAHYVTGLLVRDYILSGLPKSPVTYATEYYQHYPKIGLGHWPPAFYIVQAVWTMVFSESRASVMMLQAVLVALAATGLFALARCVMPAAPALAAGAVFLMAPMTQGMAREVMAEGLTATVIFFALWCYARYLDTQHWRHAMGFGVLAGVALLTKGTAVLLIPVPLLGLLLTRKFHLLRQPWFWLPALIVAAIAGPWYLLAPGAMHEHALPGYVVAVNEAYVPRSVNRYLSLAGRWLAPFMLLGLAVHVVARLVRRKPIQGIWAVGAAALLSMMFVRMAVPPARTPRHLLNVMPLWLLFAAAGLWWVLSVKPLRRVGRRWRAAVTMLLLPGLFALDYRPLRKKDYGGFEAVAREILARPEWKQSVILVSSDASGEGMLISEVAMRERRPGHVVLRGSKVLSASTWFGWNARRLFSSPTEVDEFLRSVPVGLIVFDGEPTRIPVHHEMLKQAIGNNPEHWELVGRFPQRRGHGDRRDDIYFYRLRGHEGRRPTKVPSQLRLANDS